ncbi:MAG TPA: PIN domain-containing protein [Solirubrobacterales bacterium]|nr:PIN domain-containing protein [Solirubrobacterales bacterium]
MNRTDRLLLDAGVWIAARDPEDRFRVPARSLVLDTARSVATLDLTFYEVANVMGARKGQVTEARHLLRLMEKRCRSSLVAADPDLLESAVELAAEHGLTAYDAAYVAAARRRGWTLVSCDVADLVSKGLAVAPDAADYP